MSQNSCESSLPSREADRAEAQRLVKAMLKFMPGEYLKDRLEALRFCHLRIFNYWRLYEMRRGTARHIENWEMKILAQAYADCIAADVARKRAEIAAFDRALQGRG